MASGEGPTQVIPASMMERAKSASSLCGGAHEVLGRVRKDRRRPKVAGGSHDTQCDLATVGDEDTGEGHQESPYLDAAGLAAGPPWAGGVDPCFPYNRRGAGPLDYDVTWSRHHIPFVETSQRVRVALV